MHLEKKKGGLSEIGLAQCPSRKSTNGPSWSIKMIYNKTFELNYESPAHKCASAHRALPGMPDGQSMPGHDPLKMHTALILFQPDFNICIKNLSVSG